MAGHIRILIVDDISETRQNIRRLLSFESELEVVGEAADGEQALQLTKQLQPDIVLMDINMPLVDGLSATKAISLHYPDSHIIIMSVQGEQEYLRRAMTAGAKDYLIKPFTGDEVLQAVQSVYALEQQKKQQRISAGDEPSPGKIITLFSAKGGVGKTTVATNLAVSLAHHRGASTVLVDASLQFGDAAVLLNLFPKLSISDLIRDTDHLDEQMLNNYLLRHDSGVKLLAAPLRPEQAEVVTGTHIKSVLELLRHHYQYVVVDTAALLDDVTLTILDASDLIMMLGNMDMSSMKNMKLCLDIMATLHYPPDKVQLILNRLTDHSGMSVKDIEQTLMRSFSVCLPDDPHAALWSVNRGVPLVQANPDLPLAQAVRTLAGSIRGITCPPQPAKRSMIRSLKQVFA